MQESKSLQLVSMVAYSKKLKNKEEKMDIAPAVQRVASYTAHWSMKAGNAGSDVAPRVSFWGGGEARP